MCLASSLLSVSSSGRCRTTFRRQSTFHCVVICIIVLICVLSLWNDRGWQCCHSNSASYDRNVWSYLLSLASIRTSRAVYMGSLRCFLLIFRICFCSIAICNLEWVWYTWRDHFRSAFMLSVVPAFVKSAFESLSIYQRSVKHCFPLSHSWHLNVTGNVSIHRTCNNVSQVNKSTSRNVKPWPSVKPVVLMVIEQFLQTFLLTFKINV